MDSGVDPFPAWGRLARMGHNVIYGHFSRVPGFVNLLCETPAAEGDDQREATLAKRALVPVEGPAVFGFEFLTEEEVRAAVLDARPWATRRARLLETREEDAVEVDADVRRRPLLHDPDDDDCNCRDCVPF